MFCFVCLMFVGLFAHAQFKASKDGVITQDGKNYYVVEIKGKNAKELFDAVEAYVIANFKNPDAVSNLQEGKMINIHGFFSKAFKCRKSLIGAHYADVDLNLIVYFKDGKIRFDAPIVNSMVCNTLKSNSDMPCKLYFHKSGTVGQFGGEINMFKKNGEIRDEFMVYEFNSFINELISNIINYVTNEASNEDW